ncbi:hypothetical protein [Metamycoplasma cloacale]|nr:hypothetical protein [Metamycoplasma cloacale]
MLFISRRPKWFTLKYSQWAKAIDTYIDYDRLKHLSMLDKDNEEKQNSKNS